MTGRVARWPCLSPWPAACAAARQRSQHQGLSVKVKVPKSCLRRPTPISTTQTCIQVAATAIRLDQGRASNEVTSQPLARKHPVLCPFGDAGEDREMRFSPCASDLL